MKENKIVVWGTGKEAEALIKKMEEDRIIFFIDNNEELWGQNFYGKRILAPEEFAESLDRHRIVISTIKYEKEIEKQLQDMGNTNFMNARQYRIECIFERKCKKKRRIVLLNTHEYINVGDHAITIAELYFFRKYLSEYEVIEIPLGLCLLELSYIRRFVMEEDLLIVTGGGFLGSLWRVGGEYTVREIVRLFPDNRIVIFPQTMFFENNTEGRKEKEISKEVYNLHKKLTFCFRDLSSYNLGIELFGNAIQKKYVPDMVMLLDRSDEVYPRNGVVMCIRKDKERILPEESVEKIKRSLEKNRLPVTEMSMLAEEGVESADRMDLLNGKLRRIQTSELVITDRLHCMIFCAISGIPCLAFDNRSGKMRGVYDWLKGLPYIRFVKDDKNIERDIKLLLSMPPMVYNKNGLEKKFEGLADFLKSEGRDNDGISEST